MSLLAVCEQGGLRLRARALRFGPRSGEEVALWAGVLVDDLRARGFVDGADDELVARALEEVGRRQSEWPTVAEVLEEARAARRRRAEGPVALPAPPLTEEQRVRSRSAIARVVAHMRGGFRGEARSLEDVADDLGRGGAA